MLLYYLKDTVLFHGVPPYVSSLYLRRNCPIYCLCKSVRPGHLMVALLADVLVAEMLIRKKDRGSGRGLLAKLVLGGTTVKKNKIRNSGITN